jgi:hypothetical protein
MHPSQTPYGVQAILAATLTMVNAMNYVVQTRWSDSESTPDVARMREILRQLDRKDPRLPQTWLTHASGWSLSVAECGLVTWANLEADTYSPRYMDGVCRETALSLWIQLAGGDVSAIERLPWRSAAYPSRSSAHS